MNLLCLSSPVVVCASGGFLYALESCRKADSFRPARCKAKQGRNACTHTCINNLRPLMAYSKRRICLKKLCIYQAITKHSCGPTQGHVM